MKRALMILLGLLAFGMIAFVWLGNNESLDFHYFQAIQMQSCQMQATPKESSKLFSFFTPLL